VEARYPGNWLEPTHEDARHALQQAEGVWDALKTDFNRRGLDIKTH
jgi:hypothetical protein